MSTQPLFLLFMLQLSLFAILAFPARTLLDSVRVVCFGHAQAADAPEMAVGVFAALGRAALLAGINGALLSALCIAIFLPSSLWASTGVTICAPFLAYGLTFRMLIALPLEHVAFARSR